MRLAWRLDNSVGEHHDVLMRTTLTLDDDVAAQLREEAERRSLPFKQMVNRAIRLGLRAGATPAERTPFHTEARRLGLRPGIDPTKLGQLADEFEAETFRGRYTQLSDATGGQDRSRGGRRPR